MRRTSPLDDGRVHFSFDQLSQDVLLEHEHQPRLAQARLADKKNDLPHTLLGLLPPFRQQADFVVAACQRRPLGRTRRFQRAPDFADFLDLEKFDGLRYPLELP